MKTLKCEKYSANPCPSPHHGGAPLSTFRGGRATPRRCSPHGGLLQAHWAVLTHTDGLLPGPSAALSTRRLWQRVQAQPTGHEARNARSYCSGQPGGTEADGETSSILHAEMCSVDTKPETPRGNFSRTEPSGPRHGPVY